MRVFVLSTHGALKRFIWLINSFPSYSLLLWILNSPTLAGKRVEHGFVLISNDFVGLKKKLIIFYLGFLIFSWDGLKFLFKIISRLLEILLGFY